MKSAKTRQALATVMVLAGTVMASRGQVPLPGCC